MSSVESDIVDVLNRRAVVLESLLECPKDKPALVDSLGISRSTIDRSVRDLEALGALTYDGGFYKPTSVGQFLGHAFFEFRDSIEVTTKLAPFLQRIDPDWFDVDVCALRDARMFMADSTQSFGPFDSHIETVQSAQLYRALLPSVGRGPMEMKYRSILENDSEHEVVVGPQVAKKLRSPALVDLLEQMLATGRISVYVTDQSVPYYLGLFDDAVQIGCCGDDGIPHAMLETDDSDVIAWGESKYGSYKRDATRFD